MSEENFSDNKENNTENIENKEESNENTNDKKYINVARDGQQATLIKVLLIILTIFIATFCAVYLVVDANMYKLGIKPFIITPSKIEKLFNDETKFIERTSPAPVKIDTKDSKYIVTISLKSFDNNPDNVEIETGENGIKISGKYEKKDDKNISERSFYQNVIFPNKIDKEKITQTIKKESIVITMPFAEENNDDWSL